MIILHDEATLLHDTVELLGSKLRPALESPERIKAIVKSIRNDSNHDLRVLTTNGEDEAKALDLAKDTHSADYLEHIQHVFEQWHAEGLIELHESVLPECFRLHSSTTPHQVPRRPKDIYARAGYYAFDMSTGMTRHSWTSIMASANLAVKATEMLIARSPSALPTRSICALTRPPGHHCTGAQAGGYCYINNILLPISLLRQHHSNTTTTTINPRKDPKFAILDLDFHHGNGTQDLAFTDPQILYVSIHGADEFPYYTGSADETGALDSQQLPTNLNLPLAPGSSFTQYLAELSVALERVRRFEPDYLLVSLGFDTFHLDPLGKFEIEMDDYATMARAVRSAVPESPSVILLEGGYVIERLGGNLLAFLRGWEDAERHGNT